MTGGDLDERIPADVTYSQPAVNRFVREVAEEVDREPQDASVNPSGDSLEVVAAKYGRKLRDNLLTEQINDAVLNADADHTIAARTHSTKPEVTGGEVAAEYPTYLTLDRSTFTLRLWEDLKLAKTYTVAVGMEGLETPEGLYHIQEKEENPVWNVPDSAWAGSLAGQTIPPGPVEPDQGPLDGDLRRRRHPRHRRDLLARLGRLARLRADGDPRRGRTLRPGRSRHADLHRLGS